jgi:hypothetical protein
MKLLTISILVASVLLSCKEISFQQPQPAGEDALDKVPATLQGDYQTYDKQSGEIGDTLIIDEIGYHLKDSNDKDWLGRGTLSDSLVVKYYQNHYFINFREGDQWVLRVIRKKSPGIFEFMRIDVQDDAVRKELLKKLSRKFQVKEIQKDDNTFYQINPSPSQLMSLINEGYFTSIELRKMK